MEESDVVEESDREEDSQDEALAHKKHKTRFQSLAAISQTSSI